MLKCIFFQSSILILIIVVMLVVKFAKANNEHIYNTLAVGLILFGLLNSILGLWSESVWLYILYSIGVFVLLFLLGLLFAYLISGVSLKDIESAAMVFLAPFMLYPIFLILMLIIKMIFIKTN